MPGTTRYSATFDRPYEEDERPASEAANGSRRSRSQSWQANVGMDSRPYTPLGYNRLSSQRSSSTDSGGSPIGLENIPTRTLSQTTVKTHNNPFQFVKVGSSPLYRKAEQQLKKVKEVKKPEVLKEEEEEWQSNLDSWKSRRRKMSEDVFRRQDEIRQLEQLEEQQCSQAGQKKTKTFSEMVESRAHRGRTMSLCLISTPFELQNWELENNNQSSNSSHPFSEGSAENSTFNSDDEAASDPGVNGKNTNSPDCTNGNGSHVIKDTCKNKSNRLFELGENGLHHKDGVYADSGLESISSSHRTGDTPDSCSDFSQDSGSSIDCDSPRVSGLLLNGMNGLESFNSKQIHSNEGADSFLDLKTTGDSSGKEINVAAVSDGEAHCFLQEPQEVLKVNGCSSTTEASSGSHSTNLSENSIECYTSTSSTNDELEKSTDVCGKHERSVESENEVFVDDFEELTANADAILSNNQESKQPSLDATHEATKSQKRDISNSALLSSPSCIDTTIGSAGVASSKKQNGNSPLTEQIARPKVEKKKLKNVEVTVETHSQEKGTGLVSNQELKKNTIKKKKIKAKIVNSETSHQEADTLQKQKSAPSETTFVDETLNIIFQSKSISCEDSLNNSKSDAKSSASGHKEQTMLCDVPPVEKVAEEMERLILQQLEEEERAKELSTKMQTINTIGSPEHNLTAPSRVSEPPKEKPPPPPSAENESPKSTSLKRVNSTKRIKKEIHKRRSNFLGIEADENIGCDEAVVPRPPALEQILKAEMELDRESRKKLESAATQRLKEESEIIEKEREIIASLETEERRKHLINNEEICGIMREEDRIQKLKEERKRMEDERMFSEVQRLRLSGEKQFREREEFIRKQEVDNTPSADLSAPMLSEVANCSNSAKSPNPSSLSAETQPNVSLSSNGGDGETLSNSASQPLENSSSDTVEKQNVPAKPVVPPKPLKKKEAIRKERERLRQEQEALQREREEHRQKLLKEQDGLMKNHQKSHAPASRLGPVPPQKPFYTPQLTNSISAPPPSARDNVIFSSQSFHGAQNGISNSRGCVEPVNPVLSKSKPVPPLKKPSVQNEFRGQQKASPVKKSSLDSSLDSKYNQNHWLIQEAEMRRIAELKERQQHTAIQHPLPQTHLAEDDVCSTSPRVPVVPANLILSPPVQEKVWNHGQTNGGMVFHPPASSERSSGIYLRESATQPPAKPSRIVPMERHEQMLSVSGRKLCSHCNEELGRGAAMIIESLQLYYHIQCFQCCVCQAQLGNGSCGTDVRVRNNKLHCHNCYSNDEAGLKFSQV